MYGKILLVAVVATICDAAYVANWQSQACSSSLPSTGRQITNTQSGQCSGNCYQAPLGTSGVSNSGPSSQASNNVCGQTQSYKSCQSAAPLVQSQCGTGSYQNSYPSSACVQSQCGTGSYQNSYPSSACVQSQCGAACYPNTCGSTCVQTPCGTTCFENSCGSTCVQTPCGISCVPTPCVTSCVPTPCGTTCFPSTPANDEALFRLLRRNVACCNTIDAQTLNLLNRYFCKNGGCVMNGCSTCFDNLCCRNGVSFGKFCCNECGCIPKNPNACIGSRQNPLACA